MLAQHGMEPLAAKKKKKNKSRDIHVLENLLPPNSQTWFTLLIMQTFTF